MARRCIAAITVGGHMPAFVSVNVESNGLVSITVRGERVGETYGPMAEIELTPEEWLKFKQECNENG